MLEAGADRNVGGSILNCCPCNPHKHEQVLKEDDCNLVANGKGRLEEVT